MKLGVVMLNSGQSGGSSRVRFRVVSRPQPVVGAAAAAVATPSTVIVSPAPEVIVSQPAAAPSSPPALDATAELNRNRREMQELEESENYTRTLLEASQAGLVIIDLRTGQIMDVNHAAADILGCEDEDLFGSPAETCGAAGVCAELREGAETVARREAALRRSDGTDVPVILSARLVTLREQKLVVLSFVDISEITAVQGQLLKSNSDLATAYEQMNAQRDAIVQSEKMASIGQLAAGVAHEINNPIGYVSSNLSTIAEYVGFMRTLIGIYRELAALDPADASRPEVLERLEAALATDDLEFVLSDIDSVLKESAEGTARVAEIVLNLKSFARSDAHEKKPHDLNESVESMVKMVWNQLKYSCKVEKELGALPPVVCHAGQISQVIMNILVNAAHSMGEKGGTISIRTYADEHEAVVEISDAGCGMSADTISRIFEPFFTTKEVGKGTGLGLSVSHGIVTDHGGRIEVDSVIGTGTTFRIILPLACESAEILIG